MTQYKSVFNTIGLSLNFGVIGINISEFIAKLDFNQVVSAIVLMLTVLWWLMKIYDQYILTKKHKKEL